VSARPTSGVAELHLRVPVGDAEALVAAGKRLIARDNHPTWQVGQPSPAADDPEGIIDSPAQAIIDLLMEGFVRCFGYNGATPLVDQVIGIEDMQWGRRIWTEDPDEARWSREEPQVGDTERWLAWKERRIIDGRERLLVPWSDPTQHEEPFDLLFETEAEAHAAREEAGAEAEPWVLVRVTFQVVEPGTDADNSLGWLRQTARTIRAELEQIRDAANGELDDEGFEQVMRMRGIELLEAAEAVTGRGGGGQADSDRSLPPGGDGVPVAATPGL
jgi:hypothetical protein